MPRRPKYTIRLEDLPKDLSSQVNWVVRTAQHLWRGPVLALARLAPDDPVRQEVVAGLLERLSADQSGTEFVAGRMLLHLGEMTPERFRSWWPSVAREFGRHGGVRVSSYPPELRGIHADLAPWLAALDPVEVLRSFSAQGVPFRATLALPDSGPLAVPQAWLRTGSCFMRGLVRRDAAGIRPELISDSRLAQLILRRGGLNAEQAARFIMGLPEAVVGELGPRDVLPLLRIVIREARLAHLSDRVIDRRIERTEAWRRLPFIGTDAETWRVFGLGDRVDPTPTIAAFCRVGSDGEARRVFLRIAQEEPLEALPVLRDPTHRLVAALSPADLLPFTMSPAVAVRVEAAEALATIGSGDATALRRRRAARTIGGFRAVLASRLAADRVAGRDGPPADPTPARSEDAPDPEARAADELARAVWPLLLAATLDEAAACDPDAPMDSHAFGDLSDAVQRCARALDRWQQEYVERGTLAGAAPDWDEALSQAQAPTAPRGDVPSTARLQ